MLGALILTAFPLLIATAIIGIRANSKLSAYLKAHHPEQFAKIFGAGSILDNNINSNIKRIKFIHTQESERIPDTTLKDLISRCRNTERAYILIFATIVIAFFALR